MIISFTLDLTNICIFYINNEMCFFSGYSVKMPNINPNRNQKTLQATGEEELVWWHSKISMKVEIMKSVFILSFVLTLTFWFYSSNFTVEDNN